MNKQEFQQTIKNMKCKKDCVYMTSFSVYQKGFEKAKELALLHSNSLDEPEKPVIPKYVADMIVKRKEQGCSLVTTLVTLGAFEDARKWIRSGDNGDTFAKAWLYGYEIDEEKRYTVEIPIANSPMGYHYVLHKTTSGEVIIDSFFTDKWGNYDYCQLTEEEIKKDHGWAWKYAKEVK